MGLPGGERERYLAHLVQSRQDLLTVCIRSDESV